MPGRGVGSQCRVAVGSAPLVGEESGRTCFGRETTHLRVHFHFVDVSPIYVLPAAESALFGRRVNFHTYSSGDPLGGSKHRSHATLADFYGLGATRVRRRGESPGKGRSREFSPLIGLSDTFVEETSQASEVLQSDSGK